MTIEEFNTEGVLIIANSTKCKEYYSQNDFNYDYPEGLAALLKQGIIHIITAEELLDLIEFVFDQDEIDLEAWEYVDTYNYLNVAEGDEIHLISHATFTQMCSNHNGDLDAQIESSLRIRNIFNRENPIRKETLLEEEFPLLDLSSGQWKVNVYKGKHEYAYSFSRVLFFLEKMKTVDPDKITLEPFEIYG